MQAKVQFRDITTSSLLYKTETDLIPSIGITVMIEKQLFLIQKVIVSFDKNIILCYGKIL
jgi:hypothetical protein